MPNRKFHLLLALVVFLSVFNTIVFYKYSSPEKVLGQSVSSPQIKIGDANANIITPGLISQSSLTDPSISLFPAASGQATVEIYTASPGSVLRFFLYDQNRRPTPQINSAAMPLLTSLTTTVTANQDNRILLPTSGEGIWYLKVKLAGAENSAFLVRSQIAGLVKQSGSQLYVWVQDLATKKTVTKGKLEFFYLKDIPKSVVKPSINDNGITIVFPPNANMDIATITVGTHVAFMPINITTNDFTLPTNTTNSFIFTDRPVYAPGDKVNFKVFSREDGDAIYKIFSGSVTVKAYPKGQPGSPFYSGTYALSDQGTADGNFSLPQSAAEGDYIIIVTTIPKNNRLLSASFLSGFRVQNFQQPDYKLSVSTESDTYVVNANPLKFNVTASYTSDTPLAGQIISYTIFSTVFPEPEYLTLLTETQLSPALYRYGFWDGKVFQSGQATLDANGHTVISLPLNQTSFRSDKPKIFTAQISLTGSNGREQITRQNILVYPGEFTIYRESGFYTGQVDREFNLPVIIKSHTGSLVKDLHLKAKIYRESWIAVPPTADNPNPGFGHEVENIPDISAITNLVGAAKFSFTPHRSGSYRFTVQVTDAAGNLTSKEFYAWISTSDIPAATGGDFKNLRIEADRTEYPFSDLPQIKVWSVIPNRDVFLSYERGRVFRAQIVSLSGTVSHISPKFKDTDYPNIILDASSFNDATLDTDTVNLGIDNATKKLKLTLAPEYSQYNPGKNVTININTSDSTGKAVAAEVALWAVEKPVFLLSQNNFPLIFDHYWSKKVDSTPGSNSLKNIFSAAAFNPPVVSEPDLPEKLYLGSTIYWNPSVKTNQFGQAKVVFRLPDSLDNIVVAGIAANAETIAGNNTTEVVIKKDISIVPVNPPQLRIGDTLRLTTLVSNNTQGAEKVTVGMTFDSGKITSQAEFPAADFTPNKFVEYSWTIQPEKLNPGAKIIVNAKAISGKTDSVTTILPVTQTGFWDDQAIISNNSGQINFDIPADTDLSQSTVTISSSANLFGIVPPAINKIVFNSFNCTDSTVNRLAAAIIAKSNPGIYFDALTNPQIVSTITSSINRLSQLQSSDGGWNWCGTSAPTDQMLTKNVNTWLKQAVGLGYSVPFLDSKFSLSNDAPASISAANLSGLTIQQLSLAPDAINIIQAITNSYLQTTETVPDVTYTINKSSTGITTGTFTSPTQVTKNIVLSGSKLSLGKNTLDISFTGKNSLSTLVETHLWRTSLSSAKRESDFSVTRTYVNSKGSGYSFGVGDILNVTFTLNSLPPNQKFLAITDLLPSGLSPLIKSASELPADIAIDYQPLGAILWIQNPKNGTPYSYPVRVISEGQFNAPPSYAQTVFTPKLIARTESSILKTEKFSSSNVITPLTLPPAVSNVPWLKIIALVIAVAIPVSLVSLLIKKLKKRSIDPPNTV